MVYVLQVYVSVDNGMWRLPIAKCSPNDSALLCTLYVAANYLCKYPIEYTSPPNCSVPTKNMDYKQIEKDNYLVLMDDEDNIIKLFDNVMNHTYVYI